MGSQDGGIAARNAFADGEPRRVSTRIFMLSMIIRKSQNHLLATGTSAANEILVWE
jgi:hypothetical protein